MSEAPKGTTHGTLSPPRMARYTMVKNSWGLHRSFLGLMFLVIVDTHSKWLDIHVMKTSHAAIDKLRQNLSVFGTPKMLVSRKLNMFHKVQSLRVS